jgi:hypothetical protein
MKKSTAYELLMASIAMGAMAGGGPYYPGGRTPKHWRDYRHPDPKNTDNSPNRAKGMKPFEVGGVTVYAGTLKAAIKKAKLLKANNR